METIVYVTYHYTGRWIVFEKRFNFGFAPFYGLSIFDRADGADVIVSIEATHNCAAKIYFDVAAGCFIVKVEHALGGTHDDFIVVTEQFTKAGWGVSKDKSWNL